MTRIPNLPALDTDYGEAEARLALATADAFVLAGLEAPGGAGGISPSTIAQGMDLSADLQTVAEALTALDANLGEPTDVASETGTLASKLRLLLLRHAETNTLLAGTPTTGLKTSANALAVAPATDAVFSTNALTNAQLRAAPVVISQDVTNAALGLDASQNIQAILADVADVLDTLGLMTTTQPSTITNTTVQGKLMVLHKVLTDVLTFLQTSPVAGENGSLVIKPDAAAVFATNALTNAQLRAEPITTVPNAGSTWATNALTDTQLRAAPITVSPNAGSVFATDALTNTQLRATPIVISPNAGSTFATNALTDVQLRATPVPVSHDGLTDAQLRAAAVPVSWTGSMNVSTDGLTNTQLRATPVNVTGPLTNTELRAAALPLPVGASTSAGQAITNNSLASLDSKVLTDTQLRATPLVILPPPTTSWSVISSTNAINTSAIPAGSRLQSLMVQNFIASAIHLQVHATTPSEGATPMQSYRIPANGSLLLGTDFYGQGGTVLSTANPVIAISSTHATYTAQISPNTSIIMRFI